MRGEKLKLKNPGHWHIAIEAKKHAINSKSGEKFYKVLSKSDEFYFGFQKNSSLAINRAFQFKFW